MDVTVLDDPTRVCGEAARLVRGMLDESRPAYAWASRLAVEGLNRGTLVGIQSSWSRFWITLHEHRARPARCGVGAIFQAMDRRGVSPASREIVGWIVLQNDYRAGALVLVHEIGHWIHRAEVRQAATREVELVDASLAQGFPIEALKWTRAQFLNELAARHLAWLAESGADPGVGRMPEPGALFACAVKIASYPEIYNDCGVMKRLVERGDDGALRDQVGSWMQGLVDFAYFEARSERAAAHRRWLQEEVRLAADGRRAPVTAAEGTL
jgi:hypothetical protein